jgi:alpha-beta hydrolase superfamily lysophospholipase
MFEEKWFEIAPGLKLFERRLLPATAPRGRVIILHGYGDHCTRYSWVMEEFQKAGMASYTYDQRGHGRSPGKRGYIVRFEELLDDLDLFLKHVREESDDTLPLFVMGHSMGGMVLARWAQTRKPHLTGLIFSSPFLAFPDEVPAILITLTPLVARLAPWAPVSKVDNRGLSRDPEIVRIADNDPLGYQGRVTAHTAGEFNRIIGLIRRELDKITLPMLTIHGKCDRVVSPSGSLLLHEHAGAEDKTLKSFEEGYHEVYNDLDKEAFMDSIVEWMGQRLEAPTD